MKRVLKWMKKWTLTVKMTRRTAWTTRTLKWLNKWTHSLKPEVLAMQPFTWDKVIHGCRINNRSHTSTSSSGSKPHSQASQCWEAKSIYSTHHGTLSTTDTSMCQREGEGALPPVPLQLSAWFLDVLMLRCISSMKKSEVYTHIIKLSLIVTYLSEIQMVVPSFSLSVATHEVQTTLYNHSLTIVYRNRKYRTDHCTQSHIIAIHTWFVHT